MASSSTIASSRRSSPASSTIDALETQTVEQHQTILELKNQVAVRGIRYCGVWEEGTTYAPGDFVTWVVTRGLPESY